MLIARAPLRISFAGGGTDFEPYYALHGGLVVSTTIGAYSYAVPSDVHRERAAAGSYRLGPSSLMTGHERWRADTSFEAALRRVFNLEAETRFAVAVDVPPGTGLGSSGAVAVALTLGLSAINGKTLSRQQVAETASRAEIQILGRPVGYQDQYASAFGGLNAIHFRASGIELEPLDLSSTAASCLQRRVMLFWTGRARDSADLLRQQEHSIRSHASDVIASLHRLKGIAKATVDALRGDDLESFGELLHESWQQKKRLADGISDPQIDRWYDMARSEGAVGGKLAGAGGGGFLMLYCREPQQESVTATLQSEGLATVAYRFEREGATLLRDCTDSSLLAGLPEWSSGVPTP